MAKQFWIHRRGKTRGPVSPKDVVKLAAAGKLDPDDLISPDNENWTVARDVKGLFPKLAQQPAAQAPQPAAQARPRRSPPAPKQSAPSGGGGGGSAGPLIVIGAGVLVALLVVVIAVVAWPESDEDAPDRGRRVARTSDGDGDGGGDGDRPDAPTDWRPPAAPDWGDAPVRWGLPDGVEADDHLAVVPGRRWVFFTDREAEQFRQRRASVVRYHFSSWVLDTVSGETTAVQEFVTDAPGGRGLEVIHFAPSSDGRYALMQTAVRDGSGRLGGAKLYVVSLRDRTCREDETAGALRWAGPRLAVITGEGPGTERTSLRSGPGGPSRETDVRGTLLGADAAGELLLCYAYVAGQGDAPGHAELYAYDASRNERIASLDLEHLSGLAVSPNGQFVAIAYSSEQKGRVLLLTDRKLDALRELVANEAAADLAGRVLPVAVRDDGAVVTLGERMFEADQGGPVVIWSPEGHHTTLATGATAATVAEGRLFYGTGGDDPAIHSIPLPETIEATADAGENGEPAAPPPAEPDPMLPDALYTAPPGAVFAAHLDWPAAKDSFMGSSESPVRMSNNAYQAVGTMRDTYLDDQKVRHPCLESVDFFVAGGRRPGWLAVVHGRFSFYMSREFLRYCFNRKANLVEREKGYYSVDIGRENDVVVALGREARDVPEDIILIGPSSLVRPGLFETLAPAPDPSLMEAVKNVDTSADAWAVGRIPPDILPIAAEHVEVEVDLSGEGESTARIRLSDKEATKELYDAFVGWLPNLHDETYGDFSAHVTGEGVLSIRAELEFDALLKITVALWPKPDMAAAQEKSKENLREIHKALARYLEDHGEYPHYLGVLAKEDYLKSSRLLSPVTGGSMITGPDGRILSGGGYVYLYTRMPPQGRAGRILRVHEKLENYDNKGTLVLLADGTVQYMARDPFNTLLRQTRRIIGPGE
jgi:hypothetical protein